jgi:opacity protein-like surface antigen
MRRIILNIVAALFIASSAAAADLDVAYEPITPITEPGGFEDRWQFASAIYLWAPSVSGTLGYDTRIGPVEVDIDASFSDLLEYLDFAFMAITEARYDRFGVFGDLVYTKLSGDGSLGPIKASIDQQILFGTLMGQYRAVDTGNMSVDVMAGARVYWVDLDTTFSGLNQSLSGGFDETWVDPMIGVKTRIQGASPWYLTAWGMIGGFGVSSDIAWDAFAGIGYELGEKWALVGGYRGLGVDYQSGGFKFDYIQHGPIFGAVFRY